MDTASQSRKIGYYLIAYGIALSFAAALVPHYTAGYKLMIGVLLMGWLPYLVFGFAVPLLRSLLTIVAGFALAIAHTLLVVNERLIQRGDYSDGFIYYGPLLLVVLLLPLVFIALRQPWGVEPLKSADQGTSPDGPGATRK